MKSGRVEWQQAEAIRKNFNIVLIHQDKKFFISELFKVIEDASIINSGLIPGGQILSNERQTVFFTVVNLMNQEHKDPYEIDLNAPRLAWYKQKKWKRDQNTVYWVDIKLAQQKGFKFYQTRSNAIILHDTPSLLYSESYYDGIWRNHIRESICVTSTSSKDFF